jgi:ABC-type uncharacterized transport system ATPase subunit
VRWTEAYVDFAAVAQIAFRRKKPKTVLLVGLNGAGKTALFFQVLILLSAFGRTGFYLNVVSALCLPVDLNSIPSRRALF